MRAPCCFLPVPARLSHDGGIWWKHHIAAVNLIMRHGPRISNEVFTNRFCSRFSARPTRDTNTRTSRYVTVCVSPAWRWLILSEEQLYWVRMIVFTIRVFSFDTPAHSWRVFSILRRMCSHFLAQCPVSSYNSLIARAKINLSSWVATIERETGTNWKLENMLNVKM